MEIILIVLLAIPFFLVVIGDITRSIISFFIDLLLEMLSAIWQRVIRLASPHPKKLSRFRKTAKTGKTGELWHYTPPFSVRELYDGLRELYVSGFRQAVSFLTPRIPRIRISIPRIRIRLSLSRMRSIRSSSRRLTEKWHPKATAAHPYTVYPVPLHLAWRIKSFFAGVVFTLLICLPFAARSFLAILPNPHLLSQREINVATKIFDRYGNLLYEIYADENRTPVSLDEIPKYLKEATIAIEDKDFYRHQGFSSKAIVRAARETLFNHHLQGGSTITQQLVKSALLTPDATVIRKVTEIILAFWAERMYTKDEILSMYLNQVPYGGTAWGIESASEMYFGKSVKYLTLAEAALLAGLPQAPSDYSPFGSHPEKAIARQHEVLRRMVEDGYITSRAATDAMNEPIKYASRPDTIKSPHFVMYVKDLLTKRYGIKAVERGGLRVKTTLDPVIQDKVQSIVSRQIASLTNLRVGNGAALVTKPATGEILAMVGSRDYYDKTHDGNVNVTLSPRQPGSSIKVVNYAAALENGFTAASILDDSPVVYHMAGSPDYAPVNYDGRFHGFVPLRMALANSYNVPAVKTLAKIGVKTMVEQGRKMGIDTWNDDRYFGLSLTLGAGEVTMTDMAEVYGTLANEGKRVDLNPILEVTDYTGRVYEKHSAEGGTRVLSPAVAFIISDILSDNSARSQAFGPNSSLVIPGHTVSVKTGTTNEKRDNWTIGYTPSYLAAVWVGNNDNTPMDPVLTSGVTGAAPIWHEIMVTLLANKPDEKMRIPESVVSVPCYFGKNEYFIKGTEPKDGKCRPLPTAAPTKNP